MLRAGRQIMLQRSTSAGNNVDDVVGDAKALAPVIAQNSRRIEQERQIVPEVLSALHEARLFRMLLPRSCNGLEVDPLSFVRVIEEIAKADASTAWCLVQASGCAIAAAYLDPAVARDIFGGPRAVMASGPGPSGKAIAVAGGYRVSGIWGFASGIRHADWLGCHCPVLESDGTPRRGSDGKPFERTMLYPKASARIEEVWDVIGLKGTGSERYSVEDLFVPAAYSFTRELAADRREAGALYRRITNYHIYGIGFAAVALGIARASLDAFIALALQKVPSTKTAPLRDSAVVQSQVAVAEAKLASSRCYLLDALQDAWETPGDGETASLEQRATLKLAGTYAAHQAKDVVDTVYHSAGATAVFASNPFERRLRDIHTVLQQIQSHFANFELVGQVLLGMPSPSKLI
ncbi:MAG: acyl-CoA dehydrogenase family protein [Xanthobacteraceae bacterium]